MAIKVMPLLFITALGGFTFCNGSIIQLNVTVDDTVVPADGRSQVSIQVQMINSNGHPIPMDEEICLERKDGQDLYLKQTPTRLIGPNCHKGKKAQVLVFLLMTNYQTGEDCYILRSSNGFQKQVSIQTTDYQVTDLDGDGFPDRIELKDARSILAFQQWFCAIAESQFHQIHSRWSPENQDCAGLVRFAMQEALKEHDEQWQKGFSILVNKGWSNPADYYYPKIPMIQEALFRSRPGNWKGPEEFTNFVSSQILVNANAKKIGTHWTDARPGDLFFFQNNDSHHLMIFIGSLLNTETDKTPYVVYHTGASPEEGGEVRKVAIDDLLNHPDAKWHPEKDNSFFLGVYRFHLIS